MSKSLAAIAAVTALATDLDAHVTDARLMRENYSSLQHRLRVSEAAGTALHAELRDARKREYDRVPNLGRHYRIERESEWDTIAQRRLTTIRLNAQSLALRLDDCALEDMKDGAVEAFAADVAAKIAASVKADVMVQLRAAKVDARVARENPRSRYHTSWAAADASARSGFFYGRGPSSRRPAE